MPSSGSSRRKKRSGGGDGITVVDDEPMTARSRSRSPEARAARAAVDLSANQDPEDEPEIEADADELLVEEDGEAMPPHPDCTSADDCCGQPQDQLVRHIVNGNQGDVYCASCWTSFLERSNKDLEGVWEDGPQQGEPFTLGDDLA